MHSAQCREELESPSFVCRHEHRSEVGGQEDSSPIQLRRERESTRSGDIRHGATLKGAMSPEIRAVVAHVQSLGRGDHVHELTRPRDDREPSPNLVF